MTFRIQAKNDNCGFELIMISNLSNNLFCLPYVAVNTHTSTIISLYYFCTDLLITPMDKLMTSKAEKYNGWAAMLGIVIALGTYATTGQIIPGIF